MGVSNFNIFQLDILRATNYPPDVNQIEGHPYLIQDELTEYCFQYEIQIINSSPLGSPGISSWNPEYDKLIENEKVKELALTYKKTVGQILIKFCLQRGCVCIPKSQNFFRIIENTKVFDFKGCFLVMYCRVNEI